jgi:NADPH:quinone reductase-like Zn-dependent oxidoreductase
MKAFYSKSYGGTEASVYGDLPDPVPGNNQLLIEVKAASINPADYKIKRGDLKVFTGSKFPKILGSDFSGIVRSAGPETSGFKPGDKVYGAAAVFFGKQGALAELVAVNFTQARLMPVGLTFEEAASLPVGALTALSGIRKFNLKPGAKVLVNGATGGVGHFAVQIAKARGADVTATCSLSNAELAKSLGADVTMGYSREGLGKTTTRFDGILDAYGKMEYEDICRLLKRGGVYASTLPRPSTIFGSLLVRLVYGKKLTSSNMRAKSSDYDEIETLLSERKLRPVIENVFPLDKADGAFTLAERGKFRGKIIVKV